MKSIFSDIIDILFLSIVCLEYCKINSRCQTIFFFSVLLFLESRCGQREEGRNPKNAKNFFSLVKNKFMVQKIFIGKNIFYVTTKSPFHLYLQSVNLSPAENKDVIENKRSSFDIFFISFFFSLNEIIK